MGMKETVDLARDSATYVLPHASAVAGREIHMPAVCGGYPEPGTAMQFLPYGNAGTIKVRIDTRSCGRLTSLCAHELGHAAMYQTNPDLLRERYGADEHRFNTLDEGVAETVQFDVQLRLALRGSPTQLLRAMRKYVFRKIDPMPDAYTGGFRHVLALRRRGVTLPEIIGDPLRFLPRP